MFGSGGNYQASEMGSPSPYPVSSLAAITPSFSGNATPRTSQLADTESIWNSLEQLMGRGAMQTVEGEAGKHSQAAREEAARTILGNHVNLIKDICNPSSQNIEGRMLTQVELVRVRLECKPHVDEGMREVVRRLLGSSEQGTLDFSSEAIEARAATARYLWFRIQGKPEDKPGRKPDMSAEAKAAAMAVLIEVGDTAWEPLKKDLMYNSSGGGARVEAAEKLISNHFKVIQDCCNPSRAKNINGIPLTQSHLVSVSPAHAPHVDAALREVARRLLGSGEAPVTLDSTWLAKDARKKMADYFDQRVHSDFSPQPPRARPKDMSEEASLAFKATCHEVADGAPPGTAQTASVPSLDMTITPSTPAALRPIANAHRNQGTLKATSSFNGAAFQTAVASAGAWSLIEEMLRQGAFVTAQGAAASFSMLARTEAVRKIVGNHTNLLKDICNPSPANNIDMKPLTQTELARVDAHLCPYVDEGLVEVCRRLLGRGHASMVLNPSRSAQAARAACARYLFFRIQSHPNQKPGRSPDMGEEAGEAMRAVLIEVGSLGWMPLQNMKSNGPQAATGAAARHSRKVREEAAAKILSNHFNVVLDICNPSLDKNIEGKPLTQKELARVPAALGQHVDEALQEVVRRLLGGFESLDMNREACTARAQMARYLYYRVQGRPDQKPGRTPDINAQATKAMLDVVQEVGTAHWEPVAKMLLDGANKHPRGAAADHPVAARNEAASRMIGNHFKVILDICNPSTSMNIENVPLTQMELHRVPAKNADYVERGFREAARRLLGRGQAEILDTSPEAQQARVSCVNYLTTRIQSTKEQKKGRKPDVSPAAAKAMLAVLSEVASDNVNESGGGGVTVAEESMSLANNLDKMAMQLRMGGRLTVEQIKHATESMQEHGDIKSRACAIM